MAKKDPYKDSPYDAAGMPLGCETVDYDKKDEVAQHMVKDKEVDLDHNLSDVDYKEPEIKTRTKFNMALNNTAIQAPGHRVHKKHEEDLGTGIPEEAHTVDLEDPANAREELVKDSLEKGKEVPELPKVAKEEEVEAVVDGKRNTDTVKDDDKDEDFLKGL